MLTKKFDCRLHQFAIACACIGASIGLCAASYNWIVNTRFAGDTIFASLFALTAAIPVWQDYDRKYR